tara:strand:- start:20850 stop:21368 length:519 start_codon:yes stop_codon:yes gene_type:complete
MITKNHISETRRNETVASLKRRIEIMETIIQEGIIPEGFEYHKSNERLMRWVDKDLNITKVGVNTARDRHPLLWDDIQKCRVSITKLEAAKKTAQNKQKSKTKNSIKEAKYEAEKKVKQLTNELVMLRIAYRDLITSINEDKHKSRILQDAIKRHNSHHGLQEILRNTQKET